MALINKKIRNSKWLKLLVLGFTGGFFGTYITVFLLDFYNPLDLFVPPLQSTVWACTCGILGLTVMNSLLIVEKIRKGIFLSITLFSIIFLIHSIILKHFILGIGKLYIIAGLSIGFGLLIGNSLSEKINSSLKKSYLKTGLVFIFSFVLIGIRYGAGTLFDFFIPIDLEIWFTWTIMCTLLTLFVVFEEKIL